MMGRRFELDVMGTAGTALGPHQFVKQLAAPTDLAAIGHRNPRRVDATFLRRLLDDAYAGRSPGTNRTTARSA